MAATPLAIPSDVAAIWPAYTDTMQANVTTLIDIASAKLRKAAPFDVDARIALFTTDPTALTALDPTIVSNVVATIVKRFLVNPDGFATLSESTGPYSRSGTYVNRYDKTGSDVRGAIQVIDSDIDELRPAVPADIPSTFQVGIPTPQKVIQNTLLPGGVIVPDIFEGFGVE